MKIEDFNKSYNSKIMRLIKQFHDSEVLSMQRVLNQDSHYMLADARDSFERLIELKMLLSTYPACDICFEPDCTSDHK